MGFRGSEPVLDSGMGAKLVQVLQNRQIPRTLLPNLLQKPHKKFTKPVFPPASASTHIIQTKSISQAFFIPPADARFIKTTSEVGVRAGDGVRPLTTKLMTVLKACCCWRARSVCWSPSTVPGCRLRLRR